MSNTTQATTNYYLRSANGGYFAFDGKDGKELLTIETPCPACGIIDISEGFTDSAKPIIFTGAARRLLILARAGREAVSLQYDDTTIELNFSTFTDRPLHETLFITAKQAPATAE